MHANNHRDLTEKDPCAASVPSVASLIAPAANREFRARMERFFLSISDNLSVCNHSAVVAALQDVGHAAGTTFAPPHDKTENEEHERGDPDAKQDSREEDVISKLVNDMDIDTDIEHTRRRGEPMGGTFSGSQEPLEPQSEAKCTQAAAFFLASQLPGRLIIDLSESKHTCHSGSGPALGQPVAPQQPGPEVDAPGSPNLNHVWMRLNGEQQIGNIRSFSICGMPNRLGFGNMRSALSALYPNALNALRSLKICFTIDLPQDCTHQPVSQQRFEARHFWVVADRVARLPDITSEAALEQKCLLLPLWPGVPRNEQSFVDISSDFEIPSMNPKLLKTLNTTVRSVCHAIQNGDAKQTVFCALAMGLYRNGEYGIASRCLAVLALATSYHKLIASNNYALTPFESPEFRLLTEAVATFLRLRPQHLSRPQPLPVRDAVLPP